MSNLCSILTKISENHWQYHLRSGLSSVLKLSTPSPPLQISIYVRFLIIEEVMMRVPRSWGNSAEANNPFINILEWLHSVWFCKSLTNGAWSLMSVSRTMKPGFHSLVLDMVLDGWKYTPIWVLRIHGFWIQIRTYCKVTWMVLCLWRDQNR